MSRRAVGMEDSSRSLGIALVGAGLGGVVIFVSVLCAIQYRRRRRRRRLAGEEALNGDVAPRHLTRLERLALPDAGADADSIRQLRQRRWAARHGNNGLTLDELDLVAPVRTYEPGKKGTAYADEASSEDGGNVDGGAGAGGAAVTPWGDASDDTCAVCLDDMMDGVKTRKLRCGHEFHTDCIRAWVTKANRCPVCSVEPLEAAAIAKRRNARSSARRGIDAAISQQRRRRTRGPNGLYTLDTGGMAASTPLSAPTADGHGATATANATGDEAVGSTPATDDPPVRGGGPSGPVPAPAARLARDREPPAAIGRQTSHQRAEGVEN